MVDDRSRAETVTRLLAEAGDGGGATDAILPHVYDELRALAESRLRGERVGHTLQATALVHEAYARLVGRDDESPVRWETDGHFFAAAAEAMRRILVDHARARGRVKRGGHRRRLELDPALLAEDSEADDLDVLAIDRALTALAEVDARKSRVVELRWLAGLTVPQTASALGVSPATVKSDWSLARAWLHRRLVDDQAEELEEGQAENRS